MTVPSKLLLAESDAALATFLKRALMSEGHDVLLTSNRPALLEILTEVSPDLIIFDLDLPKATGTDLLQDVRKAGNHSLLLVLTSSTDLETRIHCYDAGADDCLIKPFALRELKARCAALLRRRSGAEPILRYADLEVNRVDHSVRRKGRLIPLTNKEYQVLECLMMNQGRCVPRLSLMQHVWKAGGDGSTNVVDVYINYLRRKLSDATEDCLIATVRGEGYRIGSERLLNA